MEQKRIGPYGIILLAAGGSSRLGKPKQLLVYQGKTLLEHATFEAVATRIGSVTVVLGAGADLLKKEIKAPEAVVVVNELWAEGMASSIKCGLQKLLSAEPKLQAVICMVSDQPFVTAGLLNSLVAKYRETGKPVIACGYETAVGTPALFDKSLFSALLSLKGDMGAKKIIKENIANAAIVDFPSGYIDIDTELDYDNLLKTNSDISST